MDLPIKAVTDTATSTPHERARVWIYETLPLANTEDATGISFGRPHYARPAFTKCFSNIPRAMWAPMSPATKVAANMATSMPGFAAVSSVAR